MKHLILLNDPPYGTERSFNGLRMAYALAKNDPEADVAFWAEALVRRQTNAGYRLIGQSELSAGSLTGQVIELEAPLGAWDYTYLITLFVDGGDLHVIEAAGRVQDVAPHRDAILKAAAATVTGG